jgi:hypothetical protein
MGAIQGTPIQLKEQIKKPVVATTSARATSALGTKPTATTSDKVPQQPRQSKQTTTTTTARTSSNSRLSLNPASNQKKRGVIAEKNPNDSSILDLHKRTLMNSDIQDELELTDDIRFDKEILL